MKLKTRRVGTEIVLQFVLDGLERGRKYIISRPFKQSVTPLIETCPTIESHSFARTFPRKNGDTLASSSTSEGEVLSP